MYVGFDPTPTWNSEDPSRDYARGLNRNQTVMRSGTVQATFPISSRAPGVLDEMFRVVNRQGIYTQGRAPARNDSEGVRRALDEMMVAQLRQDGSLAVTPVAARKIADEARKNGVAKVPVLKGGQLAGVVEFTPEDIIHSQQGVVESARGIGVRRGAESYAEHTAVPVNRRAAYGYGWKTR